MCGIAGVVSAEGDLQLSPDACLDICRSLSRRGPDQTGQWRSREVLFVFTRLAVIDLSGGVQPMAAIADDGTEQAVLNYTGEVFNFVELRRELAARGHEFRTRSDTEVVLRAYLEWGTDCARHLRGMFAFAVWDAARREVVLIRDRLGVYPLFYAVRGNSLVFASELKALFASGVCAATVDIDGLREVLGFTPTPGLTAFRDVYEVRPGEIVTFSTRGLSRRSYWQLPAWRHEESSEETVEHVRVLLDDILRQQVVSDVPICSLLSGGLDSSVVSYLAHRCVASRGQKLRTFSMEFEYHMSNFRPDEVHDSPDSPFANIMARHLESTHEELFVTTDDLVDVDAQRAVVRAMDRPVAGLDMYVALYKLSEVVRRSSTVVLSGDGSDELFGGYRWFHDSWYLQSETFPWLGASQQMEMMSGLFDRDLCKMMDLNGYASQRYQETRSEAPRLDGETPPERRVREVNYAALTRYLRVILDRRDRVGMAVALEGRVPFCDHVLVEYVFNVPWEQRVADGREKSLLRAALGGELPKQILDRTKSPFPTMQDPSYRRALREQFLAIATDPSSLVSPLLDDDRLAALRADERTLGLRCGISRPSIEAAIQVEWWLRDLDIKVLL